MTPDQKAAMRARFYGPDGRMLHDALDEIDRLERREAALVEALENASRRAHMVSDAVIGKLPVWEKCVSILCAADRALCQPQITRTKEQG